MHAVALIEFRENGTPLVGWPGTQGVMHLLADHLKPVAGNGAEGAAKAFAELPVQHGEDGHEEDNGVH